MIEVSTSAKEWAGDGMRGAKINTSGGAEVKLGVGFEENEVKIDIENFKESLYHATEDYIRPLLDVAIKQTMNAKGVMVIPSTPVAPTPSNMDTPPAPLGKPKPLSATRKG